MKNVSKPYLYGSRHFRIYKSLLQFKCKYNLICQSGRIYFTVIQTLKWFYCILILSHHKPNSILSYPIQIWVTNSNRHQLLSSAITAVVTAVSLTSLTKGNSLSHNVVSVIDWASTAKTWAANMKFLATKWKEYSWKALLLIFISN